LEGEIVKVATTLGFVAVAAVGSAQVLYNNGGMVTHAGQGFNGADVSMAETLNGTSTAGSAARLVPTGTGGEFRIADDFTVGGPGWIVSSIVVNAYETNSATPTWANANLNIWNSQPGQGGSIVASFTSTSWAFTGIYRVFNGAGNLTNTARPIHAITFNTASLALGAGTYWIDWQVTGGASGWAPYVMLPNQSDPNAPITVFGNGQQLASTGWQPILAAPGVETPFTVNGEVVPEPASMLALAAGVGAMAARRRRNKKA
jgi:hypothetical protein